MKKSTAGLLAIMLYMTGAPAMAEEHPMDAGNFSATLTLTTDYIFRGISFSSEDPALQGSFDWGYGNVFAGVWGTSTTGISYELELDYYVGYASSFSGFDWYIQPIYYHFPGKDSSAEEAATGGQPEVFEVWLGVSRTLDMGGDMAPTVSLLYAWGPDYFYDTGTANYIYGNLSMALPAGFSVGGGLGYQDVSGSDAIPEFSYTHWDFGISTSQMGFDFDLRYHDTSDDSAGDDLVSNFLGATNLSDARIVFTVSRSF